MIEKRKYTKETEIGKQYGFLRIVDFEESDSKNGKRSIALAICLNCNSEEILKIRHDALVSGSKQSCSCIDKIRFLTKETEIGKVYGFLKIVDFTEAYSKDGECYPAMATVVCIRPECTLEKGEFVIKHSSLRSKKAKLSCGCLTKKYTAKALIGKSYGFLKILDVIGWHKENGKEVQAMAIVICERPECTLNRGEYKVRLCQLTSGETISCGCFLKEIRGKPHIKHNISEHPYYRVCVGAIHRGSDPNHKSANDYYNRGIRCFWTIENIEEFVKYLEENLPPRQEGETLDRIDNDGNYEPGNLRWATRKQQVENRRPKIFKSEFDKLILELDTIKLQLSSLLNNKLPSTDIRL